MQWDKWIGHQDGTPVMLTKNLFAFKGWELQLHKIVNTDKPGCLHTHPARAFRLVFWGGYIEEVWGKDEMVLGVFKTCRPVFFGRVEPDYTHRIAGLLGKVSYSLWLRGPTTHKIKLRGWGWKNATMEQA